VGISQFSS